MYVIISAIDGFVGLFSGDAVWIKENFVFLLVVLFVVYALYREIKKGKKTD